MNIATFIPVQEAAIVVCVKALLSGTVHLLCRYDFRIIAIDCEYDSIILVVTRVVKHSTVSEET